MSNFQQHCADAARERARRDGMDHVEAIEHIHRLNDKLQAAEVEAERLREALVWIAVEHPHVDAAQIARDALSRNEATP